MVKGKQEKRYRVLPNVTMWHDYFQCHVMTGEDYNMLEGVRMPNGGRWRTLEEIQTYLDNKQMEIYFVPVGTPHVVTNMGIRDEHDIETGELREVQVWSSAAKQWAGETMFIERYITTEE